METQIINATEYRNVSLSLLSESKTNPRRIFEENALKELAATSVARVFFQKTLDTLGELTRTNLWVADFAQHTDHFI